MIKLYPRAIYKDGGSISYIDDENNKYWLNNKIRSINKGKLYKGDINDKNPQLAIGEFELINTPRRKENLNKIIKQ